MARPRANTYDEQRTQILRSAAELFARRGYTAATMHELATAIGISKPSLYHYFSDKQSLLEEIARAHVGRLESLAARTPVPEIAGRGAGSDHPVTRTGRQPMADQAHPAIASADEARLRSLIADFMRAYAHAQNEHRVLTEDMKFLDQHARSAVLAGQRAVARAFSEAIAACRPDLPASQHKPLAMLLFGMINWTFTWLRPDGPLSHEAVGVIVADLFFGGIVAVKPAPTDTTVSSATPSGRTAPSKARTRANRSATSRKRERESRT